jgi:multidrug efflux system membrane fusion protein
MKRYAAAVAAALTAVLAGSLAVRAKPEGRAESLRAVRTLTLASGPERNVSVYSGEIRARFETPMAFRVPGRIAQRHADVGSAVRKGQLLATLDAADYQLSVQSLGAQVASAEAEGRFQASELARGAELLKKGFISQTEYDRRRNVHDQAKAKLDQTRALLSQTRNQSEYTSLRALADGTVTSVEAEAGQVIAAGQTVMRVARLEEKEAILHVPENRLGDLRGADALRVSLWAEPGRTYRGRLREISPGVDPVTRTYVAKVAILDPDPAVRIGMTSSVAIEARAREGAQRVVPLTALVARDGRTFVWRVDAASRTVDLAPVTVGAYSGNGIAVTAGLAEGDMIVTAGVHKLFPHQKVAILEDEAR